jgi:endonuclease/exonuclease/phosphatase family metal-dependent hydrolase
VEVRVLSWNLFHGRDRAPDPALHTLRSRLLRTPERDSTHAQINRDLRTAFATVLATAEWDVAMLQECPPRWAERLGRELDAEPHLALTSRNLPPPLRDLQGVIADFSPDLIASWEGGSNLTLIRAGASGVGPIGERQSRRIALRPERRSLALTRLAGGLCVANLHASERSEQAAREVWAAALAASRFARGSPLVFGGDLNLRSDRSPAVFDRLEQQLGLAPRSGPGRVDHLLARGLRLLEPPQPWPVERREIPEPAGTGGHRLRLSDHDPLELLAELPI